MNDERKPDDLPGVFERQAGFARQLVALGNVGMMFPVSIAIGFLGGYYLDRQLDTAPWLALGGFALGVAAALRNLMRSVAALERAEQAEQAKQTEQAEQAEQDRSAATPEGPNDE